jgi:hypothetical protein
MTETGGTFQEKEKEAKIYNPREEPAPATWKPSPPDK